MLMVSELHVSIEDKPILKGLNLKVGSGEVHAIMGPNGSGKSTLSHVLAGRDDYIVTAGEMLYEGYDLESLTIEERAHRGLFLAMQYPVELPGVNNLVFLRAAVNAKRKALGQEALNAVEFMNLVRATVDQLDMDDKYLKRCVNEGFSGGEKKRNEILQMALLKPKLAILDETDSGLDIDALKIVAKGVNALRAPDRSIIIVTHYQRLLNYIEPDFVHVLSGGRIVRSGTKSLATELEQKGYGWLETELVA